VKRIQKVLIITLLILVIIGIGLYIIAPHPPRVPKRVTDQEGIETYLNRLVASNNPPGLSVVVVKDGKMVYNRAFGLADGPRQIVATPETVYHWWSMTKIPTAIAIMQLQEKGLLDIDDPVEKYLPFFQVEYRGTQIHEITIRQLLSHTSGLPDPVPAIIGWVHYEDKICDQTELVKQYLPDYNQLRYAPGSDSSYTNFGYMVLGAVIEAVSGESYEDYVIEHILRPANMPQTNFLYTDTMQDHEASGSHPLVNFYTPMLPFLMDMKPLVRERDGKILWLNRVYLDVTPSSGLIGSANDVGELMKNLLASETLLSDESKTAMLPTGELPGERPLGWAEYELGERPWVQHPGGGPGFATLMRLYPEENLGIAILANGTDLDGSGLANLLAGIDW
jgi:D-alanyl-D-alanine carboxypeptidase